VFEVVKAASVALTTSNICTPWGTLCIQLAYWSV